MYYILHFPSEKSKYICMYADSQGLKVKKKKIPNKYFRNLLRSVNIKHNLGSIPNMPE